MLVKVSHIVHHCSTTSFIRVRVVLKLLRKGRHWVLVVSLHVDYFMATLRSSNIVHIQVLLLSNVVRPLQS